MAEKETPQGAPAPLAPKPDVVTGEGAPTRGDIEKAEGELGADEVQKATDAAEEKGYIGVKTDPRPNSDYSQIGGMPGVTKTDE